MWCPSCRTDVAGELSTDNRRMLCARCHSEVGISAATLTTNTAKHEVEDTERDARELLARWSSPALLEPPAPIQPPLPASEIGPGWQPPGPETQVALRNGSNHGPAPTPKPAGLAKNTTGFITLPKFEEAEPIASEPPRAREEKPARHAESTHDHAPMTPPPSPPHRNQSENEFTIDYEKINPPNRRRINVSTSVGQVCAYSGVCLLTIGSVLAIWSFFGGPPQYMATGWLTAAVGQLLLFLGVVTLISAGLQQTAFDVTWRIDHLAEEVHHLSQGLDDLERRSLEANRRVSESAQEHTFNSAPRKAA